VRSGSGYEWKRAPLNQPELGHTIQNNRNFSINAQLNFTKLYKKIDFFHRINNGGRASRGRSKCKTSTKKDDQGKDGDKDDDKKKKKKKKSTGKVHPVLGFLGRVLMSVRNVSGTYTVSDGIMLPGYKKETRVLGFDPSFQAPGFGFAFGQQNKDIWGQETGRNYATTAADKGWLVENELLNTQHIINHSQTINGKVTLEPLKDFRIDVTLNRTYTENLSEYFRWDETLEEHVSQSAIETGMLSFTSLTIATAFENYAKSYDSKAFNNLLAYRAEVSTILGKGNPNSSQAGNLYTGYGESQQDVLIGAFLAAYSGRSPNEKNSNAFKTSPMPNWSANYSGLTKFKWARKFVRSFSLKHSYSSNVNMAGIQTNLKSVQDSDGHATNFDLNNNYEPGKVIQNVVIAERFGPLIGFDATWIIKSRKKKSTGKINKKKGGSSSQNGLITKFEWRKDRSVSLGLTNNQVTEVKGNEYIFGVGYKFPEVTLPFKIRGKKIVSDLNVRGDVSIRDNVTIVRKIDNNTSQATAGQNVISIKASIDYNLGPNLNLQLYYDQQITKPKVSISYPTGNLNAGLRLRINLGGLNGG
jgi:cell surface protein SprA